MSTPVNFSGPEASRSNPRSRPAFSAVTPVHNALRLGRVRNAESFSESGLGCARFPMLLDHIEDVSLPDAASFGSRGNGVRRRRLSSERRRDQTRETGQYCGAGEFNAAALAASTVG